jgi:hypothetical protein
LDRRKLDLILIAVEWLLLLISQAAFITTEQYTDYVTLGLVYLLAAFFVRALRTHRLLPRTGLEIPWVLGLASAGVAVWIAYDRGVALLQFYRLLSAFVIYYAVVSFPGKTLRWPAAGLLLFGAALALYWPISYDFASQPGKLALITQLGLLVNRLAPAIPGPYIHSNVAAGALLTSLLIGAALVVDFWHGRQRLLAVAAGVLSLVVLGGLFLTGSRGAWLGLAAAIALGALAWAQRRWLATPAKQLVFWSGIALLGVLAIGVIAGTGNQDRLVGAVPDPTGSLQSRTVLWGQSLDLARDALFTGSGLQSFFRVHAIYRLLLHTPYLFHAHNTFLEVLLEQGIFGLIGLLWAGIVVVIWAWKALGRASVSIWGWAGLAALIAASVHGMVDVVFYVTRTLPLIGLMFGYAWFLNETVVAGQEQTIESHINGHRLWQAIGLALLVLALLAAVIFSKPLLAAGYANRGVAQQVHVELTRYNPYQFDKYSLDQVRHDSVKDGSLEPALASFNRALQLDPTQRTALQRLAQINLSLGDYAAALEATTTLWQAGHRDEVTRLLYGDALVATGQIEPAVETVDGISLAISRLRFQAWYRYWIDQDYRRAADAWTAVLLLDPESPDIDRWLKQAQEKLQ